MSRLAPKEALPSYGSVSTKALVAENAESQTLDEKASIAIFLNAIIGPGIVALPKLYQVSGWLLPSVILVVGGFLAAFATPKSLWGTLGVAQATIVSRQYEKMKF